MSSLFFSFEFSLINAVINSDYQHLLSFRFPSPKNSVLYRFRFLSIFKVEDLKFDIIINQTKLFKINWWKSLFDFIFGAFYSQLVNLIDILSIGIYISSRAYSTCIIKLNLNIKEPIKTFLFYFKMALK